MDKSSHIRSVFTYHNYSRRMKEVSRKVIDRFNALQKIPDASTLNNPVIIRFDDEAFVFWLEDPRTGHGWDYGTLKEAVTSWHIDLVDYDPDTNTWSAEPKRQGGP